MAPQEELLEERFDLALTAASEGRNFDLGDWPVGREHFAAATRATTATIGLAIEEALTAGHAAGRPHRDIRPGNIHSHEDGSRFISDFGHVRDAGDGVHTATGEVLGTAAFAALERLRGAQ